jgi:hypothetical protein
MVKPKNIEVLKIDVLAGFNSVQCLVHCSVFFTLSNPCTEQHPPPSQVLFFKVFPAFSPVSPLIVHSLPSKIDNYYLSILSG